MKKRTILLIFILINLSVFSQQVKIFQGYEKTIGGFRFSYHSPLNDQGSALLSRAQADYQPIIWETERVPADYHDDSITFLWAYGMDVTPDVRNFDFYINDKKYFTIHSPLNNDKKEWSLRGIHDVRLVFNVTKIDKYKDQMGFASLTLPMSLVTPGRAVRLKVEGEKAKSNVWYMTFTEQPEQKFSVTQHDLLMKKDKQLFYVLEIDFTNIGKKTQGKIMVDDQVQKVNVFPGVNSFEVLIPKSDSTEIKNLRFMAGDQTDIIQSIEVKPVKHWTVNLVQHAHTDIGYTRPQTEILPEHLRYIDYALDYCDQTDNYPDNAKFRWTCEASWAVREYLKNRPKEQIERLVRRVNESRIEVTGMIFNLSDIIDEGQLAAQLQPLNDVNSAGIHVKTLMQDDVNGIGWALIDDAQNTSIRYVLMGEHGHRARIPFNQPTAFWWESPSGNRLLAYRSEHYMHGNVLGLTSGSMETFKKGLAAYLSSLDDKGYPFSETAFQFSGFITDNSPPSTTACELVKDWNATYEWPKLRLSVAGDFMEYLEKEHADDLPVYRAAWPDWWVDGFGSAMRETEAIRNTQNEMMANTGLLAMAQLAGAILPAQIGEDIRAVSDDILFYDEHTFGAAESISDPFCENSMVQWNEKSAYAWDAVMKSSMLKEKAMGIMQAFIPKTDDAVIAVFNTLNWERSGMAKVYIDHEIIPEGRAFKITDRANHEIKAQTISSRSDGSYYAIWFENIPAFGYKTYRIELLEDNQPQLAGNPPLSLFENPYYSIRLDEKSGLIQSIYDKELQQELTDTNDTLKAGEFIYEQLANRHQMERFTSRKMDTRYVPLEGQRESLCDNRLLSVIEGPVWKSLFINGKLPGCTNDQGVGLEVRLYQQVKRIEFHYRMVKLPVTSPESIYIAFPFSLPGSHLLFESHGGMVQPGVDQLEGTSADWNAIQHFASVKNAGSQIVFSSNDIPIVQFGAINTGRFYYQLKPKTSHIYSWVLNNYWTTNFKASQEGELKWSYAMTSAQDASNAFATRFGWGNAIPLLTRVIPAGNKNTPLDERSLMDIRATNILLVKCMPSADGKGILLHLRETEGKPATLNLTNLLKTNKPGLFYRVNVLGKIINECSNHLELEPNEVAFIKVENSK